MHWAAATVADRVPIRVRKGASKVASIVSAATTTNVAIGLINTETMISAERFREPMSATQNDETTPAAVPAKAIKSSCSRPEGSACWVAHEDRR